MSDLSDLSSANDSYDGGAYDHSAGAINQQTVAELRGTRPWVLFLSILGFIGTAFMALATVLIVFAGGQVAAAGPGGGVPIMFMVLFYAIATAISFFCSLFLFKYASHIGNFVASEHVSHLNAALAAQKGYWRLIGIIMAVYIGFVLVALMLAIVGGGIASMR